MSEDQVADLTLPPLGKTKRVEQDALQVWTLHRETDARSALTRGLREYLEQLMRSDHTGREIRLIKVFEDWSEPEEDTDYPSALIYSSEAGAYDAKSFTPDTERLPNGFGIRRTCEFVIPLTVEVIANDPHDRRQLMAMLEDELCPHEHMYGLRLELPHYHNARATFEPLESAYNDDPDLAQRRLRGCQITVQASVPVVRVIGKDGKPVQLPLAEYRTDVEVTEPG